jgi:hypothetical protein
MAVTEESVNKQRDRGSAGRGVFEVEGDKARYHLMRALRARCNMKQVIVV